MTIRNCRERVRECEALGEYALAEQIRQILVEERDYQIDLATALGVEVPNVSSPKKQIRLIRQRGLVTGCDDARGATAFGIVKGSIILAGSSPKVSDEWFE